MKQFIIILFLLFIPVSLMAEISVSINLNHYESALADSVRMVVSITGSRDSDEPQISGLENFIVRNSGKSSRVQIINGRFSSNLDYTYFLQSKKTGVFEIGPASVKVDGKIYRSNSVKLTVKESVDQKGQAKAPVFLTAALSSKRVYLEEQISYTLRLYHTGSVSDISLAMPDAEGLTFKQMGKPAEYNTVYNLKNYQVLEVRYSLIPSKPGRFNINPAKMSMLVHDLKKGQDDGDRAGNDDFFSVDDFSENARGRSVTIAANPLAIEVLPVPEYGRPADYTGLIGSFSISAGLEPLRIKAGESATLTVVLKGSGNINRAPDLKIPEIANAKIYADEPKIETQQTDKGIEGQKVMKWAVVPVKEGQYTIPPLYASYFDTAGHYYKTVKTAPLYLKADPGTGEIAQSPFTRGKEIKAKEAVEELGKDILPVHKSIKNISDKASQNIGILSCLLLLLPAFAYGITLAGNNLRRKTPAKEARFRAYKAPEVFYKACKDKELSAGALSDALRNYINSRLHIELGGFTPSEIREFLREKGCSGSTADQAEWILKKIETLIYTGKGAEPCDLSKEALNIVRIVEKELK